MAFFPNDNSLFKEKSLNQSTSETVDQSTKYPVLFFIFSGIVWLIISSLLALISAFQEINGSFLSSWEWLTYGRIKAVSETLFIYGWCGNAIFAIGLWVMARLCQRPLFGKNVIFIAGLFWNIAVKLALFGVLVRGDLTGIPYLEVPVYAAVIATISAVVILTCGILTFSNRHEEKTFVSQWYLLAAFLFFPWLMTTGVLMLFIFPASGTIQSIIEAWFAYNIFGLWLTPVALAVGYYLIPKILKKTISNYPFSAIGFWTLLLFNSWTGVYILSGGPVPSWVATTGIAANLCLFLPLTIISLNYYQTLQGNLKRCLSSPVLRFILVGVIAFTLFYIFNALVSLRIFSAFLKFTYFTEGLDFQRFYVFSSMMFFGAIYFIVHSIAKPKGYLKILNYTHFFASLGGGIMIIAGLCIGGWIQGSQLNTFEAETPVYTVMQTLENITPWLKSRLIGWGILFIGHIVFAIYFIAMLLKIISIDLKKVRLLPNH